MSNSNLITVAFFCPTISFAHGPTRFITNLANKLSGASFNKYCFQTFIIEKYSRGKAAFPLKDSVKVFSLCPPGKADTSNAEVIRSLIILLKELGISVLIIFEPTFGVVQPLTACFITGVPSITWDFNALHLIDRRKKVPEADTYSQRNALKLVIELSSKIVFVSNIEKEIFSKTFPKKKEKMIHIPNMIRKPSNIKYDTDSRKIVSVGSSINSQKGFDLLLNIWQKVVARRSNHKWKLDIYGKVGTSFEDRLYYLALKERTSKIGNVQIKPFSSNIETIYKNASIYAMSSRHEGFPFVLLEAQAFGIPTVAFDILTGPSEIISNGTTGFLVPPYDVDEYAKRIQKLISSESLRLEMSIQSRIDIDRFSASSVVPKWLFLLSSVCSQN